MVPKRKDNRTETSIDFATRPSTYLDENNEEREKSPPTNQFRPRLSTPLLKSETSLTVGRK